MLDPIVITGLGAISPLGSGVLANWRRLLAGQSGIVLNTRLDTTAHACKIAGLVPLRGADPEGFDPDLTLSVPEQRKSDLFIHYAIAAATEALAQAGWMPDDPALRARTATVIATGVGGLPAITRSVDVIRDRGPRRLSPFTVPSFLPNLAAGQVAIRFGFSGPSGAPVTACAASAQAIGDAFWMIRNGLADIALCGGAEASVDPVGIGGFEAARALCISGNDQPARASRPFDQGHDGFVLSEGAAMLVIERQSHAIARGAEPLAEIAGYGTTTDAYHVTSGWPDGREAARAMRLAIDMAGIDPLEIGYINAHSTSTAVGDAAELAALASIFGTDARHISLSSTKSSTGHMLGAAGAIESVFSVLALRDGLAPAGLNIEDPMPETEAFDLVSGKPCAKDLRYVLSNAFGFGGVNAALVFKRCGP